MDVDNRPSLDSSVQGMMGMAELNKPISWKQVIYLISCDAIIRLNKHLDDHRLHKCRVLL